MAFRLTKQRGGGWAVMTGSELVVDGGYLAMEA